MKRMLLVMVVGVCLGFVVMAGSGCAIGRVNLVDDGVVTVDEFDSEEVYVAGSKAYNEGGELVVRGMMKRHDDVRTSVKAHVEVMVMSADERVMEKVCLPDVYIGKQDDCDCDEVDLQRFKARFPMVRRGTRVSIVAHEAHDEDGGGS